MHRYYLIGYIAAGTAGRVVPSESTPLEQLRAMALGVSDVVKGNPALCAEDFARAQTAASAPETVGCDNPFHAGDK